MSSGSSRALVPLDATPPPRPRRRASSNAWPTLWAGIFVVAVTFAGFGTWAAVTPLARGAHVVGKVVVASNRKTIQHLEGGIVESLFIREGDRVAKGDVLLQLDPTQSNAQREILFDRWLRQKALEARLEASVTRAETLEIPKELVPYAEDDRFLDAFSDQRALFQAQKEEFESEIAILTDRADQLRHQIDGMNAQVEANLKQQRLIEDELTGLRELLEKGHVPLNRVRSFEREQARLEGENAQLKAEIARAQVGVGEAELEIIRTKQKRRREALDQLREVRGQLGEVIEQLVAAEDVLARTKVTAPVTGHVVGLNVHTVGAVVKPGETVLEIVPENDDLIIEGRVNPLDGDIVHPGMEADVRLLGLPRKSAPLMQAKLLTISADTMTDAQTGASYYLARIKVADEEMDRLPADVQVVPGMPADVLIKAGERTPFEYLIAPWTDLFSRAMREQ